jgi:hypothetical protein
LFSIALLFRAGTLIEELFSALANPSFHYLKFSASATKGLAKADRGMYFLPCPKGQGNRCELSYSLQHKQHP